MRDYLSIGPVPCDEDCQQVGTADYDPTKARQECSRFIQLLRKVFGPEPDGAELRVKQCPHDFGTYLDVVCWFDDTIPESIDYAFRLESETPATWND